jgi:hypothetical protein
MGCGVTKLLSTSAFPELPADPSVLAEAAEAYRAKAALVEEGGEAARETWRSLAGVYRAPEADTALSRMDKVRDTTANLHDAAAAIADALGDFATILSNCKTSLDTLRDDVTAARAAEARQREDWEASNSKEDYEIDPRIVEQDTASRDLLAQLKRTLANAEEECVAALKRVSGGTGEELPQPAGPPSPDTKLPDWTTAADAFGAEVTTRALDALADLHATEPKVAAEYAADHEADFTALIRTPLPVERAAEWWAGLAPAASTALTALVPLVIGNMGGVPYAARDAALRGYVSAFIPGTRHTTKEWDDTISNVKKQLSLDEGSAPRQLITLDPTDPDQPRAAISVGLLDDADNVTFLVPGMGTTPQGNDTLPSWLDSADALQREQLDLQRGSTPAVVAWIGYDTPQLDARLNESDQMVARDEAAIAGGELLAAELLAADAATENDARVNVVAHSYGTTVASEALQRVSVDSLTMAGSAGLTVDSVNELHVPRDQIFAAESPGVPISGLPGTPQFWLPELRIGNDFVAPFGRAVSGRVDPDTAFGATRFSVDGSGDRGASYGHAANPGSVNLDGSFASEGVGYLSAGTESLYNIALIVSALGAEVSPE